MASALYYSERTKSFLLHNEANSGDFNFITTLKTVQVDDKIALSIKIVHRPTNFVNTVTQVCKFDTVLGFIKLSSDVYLLYVDKSERVAEIRGKQYFKIKSVKAYSLNDEKKTSADPNIQSLTGYFNSGAFYYSTNSEISANFQLLHNISEQQLSERKDIYLWNSHMLKPLKDLITQIPLEQQSYLLNCGLFSEVCKGFFSAKEINLSSSKYQLAVFTRLGRKKAGTRFNSRGLDDEGNVSIYGETEVIISNDKFLFSYILLRGSVPVFWEQQGIQIGAPKIQITRAPLATQPSFDRHFEFLLENYGLIHCLNLLSSKDGSIELLLTNAYEYHVNHNPHSEQISVTSFDLNKMIEINTKSGLDALFQYVIRDIQVFGYYLETDDQTLSRTQKGIFRVNCFDCLDRTNMAQDFIARKVVDLFFRNYLIGPNFKQLDSIRMQSCIGQLFADNGDAISMIYAGTPALRTAHTRKGESGFFDYVEDFKKSAHRLYCGHVTDKVKQESVDLILGLGQVGTSVDLFNPVSQLVQTQLSSKRSQFTTFRHINVSCLTWNTGGFSTANFDDYYIDFKNFINCRSDIFVFCLQEIVQLNATQIMSSDPEKRVLWDIVFMELIEDFLEAGEYVQLVSNQLVGVSLTVFVRSSLVDEIKNVEISSLKTGLGGITGNKGSIGIRMELMGNSYCFVGSHFTAGQNAANERLREFLLVKQDLIFPKGKRIMSHDFIYWMGDFNFRNDCESESAKEMIKRGDFESLLKNDQLMSMKKVTKLFESFSELPITFAPTYKYDPGTSTYDTSEKNRVPSWTDRILYSGSRVTPKEYNRLEIDVSDHRPVYLHSVTEIELCDKQALQRLEQDLFTKLTMEQSEAPELPPRPML